MTGTQYHDSLILVSFASQVIYLSRPHGERRSIGPSRAGQQGQASAISRGGFVHGVDALVWNEDAAPHEPMRSEPLLLQPQRFLRLEVG